MVLNTPLTFFLECPIVDMAEWAERAVEWLRRMNEKK